MSRRRPRRRASWAEATLEEQPSAAEREEDHECPDPIAQADIEWDYVARAQYAGDRRRFVQLRGRVGPPQGIDELGDPRIRRARDTHASLDRAQHEVRRVLRGGACVTEPGIVGHVDEEIGPVRAIGPCRVLKRGFVADHYAELA